MGQVFVFNATDVRHEMCLQSFSLSDDPNKTTGFHEIIRLKPIMLIELCAGNYCTEDRLVNGAEGIFRQNTNIPSMPLI